MPLMTPIHRRMGEFVLANPFRAATMRIDELAQAVNASIATANRFAKALGFDGYPAMRAALVRGFEATLGPVERLRSAQEQESGVRGAAWIDAVFDPPSRTSRTRVRNWTQPMSRPRSRRSSAAARADSRRGSSAFSPG